MSKIALVHDYLNQYGGAERVLEILMEIFPEAPIYTILHDKEKTLNRFRGRIKKTTFLDFPFARKHHRLFIPFMPSAIHSLDLGDKYDLIISDTAGFAKGIRYDQKKTKHISYIHSPLRYAWEPDYLNFKFWKFIFKPVLNYLKKWDFKAAQKPNILIANSQFIANKIKRYYNRDAQVIYPPVDTTRFFYEKKSEISNYYLAVGRLIHYKKFGLIIDAFTKLGLSLKIVGDGPEEQKLKTQSEKCKANVEFIGFVNDENELRKLYNEAQAVIFPQVEDFGLVAAEAQACGTPVIAFAGGGAMEVVQNGVTGILFHEQSVDKLSAAVREAEKTEFNREQISQMAQKFSKDNFKKQILQLIEGL